MKSTPSRHLGSVSRRQFLRGALIAGAAINVVPSHVLGLDGFKSPNERLNIAGIGMGSQGGRDMDQMTSENIVALCDVDQVRSSATFKKFPKAKQYKDYRKMLEEQKDIDAVVVATPDHLHAFASMAAMKMGKHVYCEKPLTHSVWEARQITAAARQYKVATQMGNQGQASEETRRLCEMVWDGAIGAVREVHIWTDRPFNGSRDVYWKQGIARPTDTPPVPPTLDWDLWLGPAPERPYNPAYLPFKWRGWQDFGTGALGDMGCHSFDPVFRALKLGHPLSVEANCTPVNKETYPVSSTVTYQFPAREGMPPVKLVWYDGHRRPERPAELEAHHDMGVGGHLLIGDKGKIMTQRQTYRLIPESKQNEYGTPPKKLPRSIGHYKEWIEACKGGKPGGSQFDWAGPLTEVVLIGNAAVRLHQREELSQKKLLWDGAAMRFTNSDDANQFLRRDYRQGWSL